jgi:hypothetical protein
VGGPAEPTIGRGDARRPSSRAVAAALVGVAYTAALAIASWNGAMDGDDDGTSVALGVVGERMEEFDNELRYFNWALMLVLNAAFAAVGAWLARRSA